MAKKTVQKPRAKKSTGGDLPPALANKSEAIRAHLKANPTHKAKDVVAALQEQGIDVTPNYISIVKSSGKKKKGRKLGHKAAATSNGHSDQGKAIAAAVLLFKTAGGAEGARSAIKLVESIANNLNS